jgi:putative FmdB family regulatory protein
MPVYQYRGTDCDHVFEVRQSFSDDPLADCDVCGNPVRRVIHAAPVVFKGSGWYVTDSRPSRDPVGVVKDAATKETSDSPESAPAPDKPESKPAAKSDPAPAPASAD